MGVVTRCFCCTLVCLPSAGGGIVDLTRFHRHSGCLSALREGHGALLKQLLAQYVGVDDLLGLEQEAVADALDLLVGDGVREAEHDATLRQRVILPQRSVPVDSDDALEVGSEVVQPPVQRVADAEVRREDGPRRDVVGCSLVDIGDVVCRDYSLQLENVRARDVTEGHLKSYFL